LKSREIAKQIYQLAVEAGIKQVFLVGNKVEGQRQEEKLREYADENRIPLLHIIPFDRKVVEAEIQGKTPLLQKETAAFKAMVTLGEKLLEEE
jgi:CO dehydrogenase nickel-insertion accessory protein CooC1